MKQIRSTDKLPEWFDLSAYNVALGFGPMEWYCEIGTRARFYRNGPARDTPDPALSACVAHINGEVVFTRPISDALLGQDYLPKEKLRSVRMLDRAVLGLYTSPDRGRWSTLTAVEIDLLASDHQSQVKEFSNSSIP